MTCAESDNVVCKHRSASITYYVDLDARLQHSVTVLSATASTEDEDLTISQVQVLDESLQIEEGSECQPRVLVANRAILIQLTGGVPSDDEIIVTVQWAQSDGDEDALDCRVLVT